MLPVRLRDRVVQRPVEGRRARAWPGRCPGRGSSGRRLLPNSARMTKILSVFSRLSSTYWSWDLGAAARTPLPLTGLAVADLPTLTTVLAPRFSTLALLVPSSRPVMACSRSARFFSSAGLASSSLRGQTGPRRRRDSSWGCGPERRRRPGHRGSSPVPPPAPGSPARQTSCAQFLRQQRSCRVRRSSKSVAGRWPAPEQERPGIVPAARLREQSARVHRNERPATRAEALHGAAGLRDCMFSQNSGEPGPQARRTPGGG